MNRDKKAVLSDAVAEDDREPAITSGQKEKEDIQTDGISPEEKRIEELLLQMTLREKVSQMFIIRPEDLTGVESVTQAGETTYRALKEHPVGGVILSKNNLVSPSQVTEMNQSLQRFSNESCGVPILITVDEEGGKVSRCAAALGTTAFLPMYQYKEEGAGTAFSNARTIGADIAELGFNLDFAPVADVWSNRSNTVIGSRAYSDDFAQAAELVSVSVKGFHTSGMACTLKHFPGHGDTAEDSHDGAAYSDKSLEEIKKEELTVFQSGIDAGADAVMVGHITLRNVDDRPATLSSLLIEDILREEMGFEGVVITDALAMGAVSELYSPDELCVRAVIAGNDILLEPKDYEAGIEGICKAVEDGRINESRIDESVRRILKLKLMINPIEKD